MSNQPISNEALHNLLKQLFPETQISRKSVDLVAIQIAKLEPESAFSHFGTNEPPIVERYIERPQQH